MRTFDETADRTHLSDRDQLAWMQIRNRANLRTILQLLHQTNYMAMAQVAAIYGGSPANARREIRVRLVESGLAGQEAIRGNGYLYLRPAGARLVTGDPRAAGVLAIPENPGRVLTEAFARVQWWIAQKPDDGWKWIPGTVDPRNLSAFQEAENRPYGDVDVHAFRRSLGFRGGVYPLVVNWDRLEVTVTYLVVDLGRSRSAYRELITRIRESARTLHYGARVTLIVIAGSQRRKIALEQVLGGLRMDPPVALGGADGADHVAVWNFEVDRYLTYGFHR